MRRTQLNMASDGFDSKRFLLCVFVIFSVNGVVNGQEAASRLIGYRLETPNGQQEQDRIVVYYNRPAKLRLFGAGLDNPLKISFTDKKDVAGENCDDLRSSDIFAVETEVSDVGDTGMATVTFLAPDNKESPWYFCMKLDDSSENVISDEANATVTSNAIDDLAADGAHWVHQGSSPNLMVYLDKFPEKSTLLPIWLQSILILFLLLFSGLFSGLNLGLMSLDKTDLRILQNSGSPKEQKYAKTITPVRSRGNFLLCTILLGNVLVNNTLAILLDDLSGSGLTAVIGATAGIVVFGEIIPQAVCSRYGLAIGAHTIWFTRFFMIITFPMSFPISKVLDLILGEEIGNVYNRDRLRELLKVTETQMDLVKDEVQIITGALELSKKTVMHIMTKLDDVYMIEYNSILDFETMSTILKTGYTRIPIYEKERTDILAILNVKDLAFIDPDDRTPLSTVYKFYNHPVNFVYDDTTLQIMLEEFKKGRFHMSFVQRVNDSGPGDPYYETLGVVTLEDVIEEIIQAEIVDETDTVFDNRSKARRVAQARDFSIFLQPAGGNDDSAPRISPQLTLATFQFLSTSVAAFHPDFISEAVLHKLLKQNVIMEVRTGDKDNDVYLFNRGKAIDYFAMVLEGRVEVSIGKENMTFEGGPFIFFGEQALAGSTISKQQSIASISSSSSDVAYQRYNKYIPDFSVKATCNVVYLRIRRPHYVAACRATNLERSSKDPDEEVFSKEWLRACSVDPDHVGNDHKASERPRSDTADSEGAETPLMVSMSGSPLNTPTELVS